MFTPHPTRTLDSLFSRNGHGDLQFLRALDDLRGYRGPVLLRMRPRRTDRDAPNTYAMGIQTADPILTTGKRIVFPTRQHVLGTAAEIRWKPAVEGAVVVDPYAIDDLAAYITGTENVDIRMPDFFFEDPSYDGLLMRLQHPPDRYSCPELIRS